MKAEKSLVVSALLKILRPLFELLLVVFIVLKSTDTIDWSWWIVLSPFSVPCCIVLIQIHFQVLKKMKEKGGCDE